MEGPSIPSGLFSENYRLRLGVIIDSSVKHSSKGM